MTDFMYCYNNLEIKEGDLFRIKKQGCSEEHFKGVFKAVKFKNHAGVIRVNGALFFTFEEINEHHLILMPV
ncbi:putative Fe-S cluster-containing protein [Paenibacillus sp. 1182]|uniref:hypothetical protein n=1 Tax=Paenibacillus sp. 1182 TaxID=2806565 RepID=UPI001AEA8FCC|nr:hypothetical protein [Paenibacillus sp. 1182]MBP1308855.1 putative Fe-S cluster-containing protein [Paenibacillus sp. 1182]